MKAESSTVRKIVDALAGATRPSDPWCEGPLAACDPGLQIDGVGPVRLPLRPAGLRKLREVAIQAPYGKRTDTIVDTRVRDTLEVAAESVAYSAEFADAVRAAAGQVAESLRLDPDRLRAELYKLLIYTKGSFFLPHCDSEKVRGMVGTMIVVLPSKFSGGELIVSHGGRRKAFSFGEASDQNRPHYAAFFADCQHEIRKVTSGVRVCLAFNLVLGPEPKKSTGGADSAADSELLRHVSDWIRHRESDPLVFALEHQYTENGLKPYLLKGADKELYRNVAAVSEAIDCRLHFGQVSRHLCQFADDGSFGYGRRRYRGWSGDCDDLDIGEVYDDEIVIDGWKNAKGTRVKLPPLPCESSQLISATPVEAWTPTRQDYEGYTGNAGNTLDRWYHKSAIVVWPRRQEFEILAEAGFGFAVERLLEMREALSRCGDDELEQACDECQQLAEAIIRHWPKRVHNRHDDLAEQHPGERRFTEELPKFDDPMLVGQFLRTVAARDRSVKLDRFVVASLDRMGGEAIVPSLRELIEFELPPNRFGVRFSEGLATRDASWLLKLASHRNHGGIEEEDLEGLLRTAVGRLSEHARRREAEEHRRWDSVSPTAAWLTLSKAAIAFRGFGLEALLRLPSECPTVFDLRDFQASAARTLHDFAMKRGGESLAAVDRWIEQVRASLREATAQKPERPTTFSRKSETGCDCTYCAQLSGFLRDPASETTRIPARADRRDHMVSVIRQRKLDVTTRLVRSGSPHSLELTKTTASYEDALKRYQADLALLAKLR